MEVAAPEDPPSASSDVPHPADSVPPVGKTKGAPLRANKDVRIQFRITTSQANMIAEALGERFGGSASQQARQYLIQVLTERVENMGSGK